MKGSDNMLWDVPIAESHGYGKGRKSVYSWIIFAICTLCALAGYLLWVISAFKAEKEMYNVFNTLNLNASFWGTAHTLLIVAAVVIPILFLLGLLISLWRGLLAGRLKREQVPSAGWKSGLKAWLGANVGSSILLWLLQVVLIAVLVGSGVWAGVGYAGAQGSRALYKELNPKLQQATQTINSSAEIISRLVNAAAPATAPGGRRRELLAVAFAPMASLVAAAVADGSSSRRLQQLPGLGDLGSFLSSTASNLGQAAGGGGTQALAGQVANTITNVGTALEGVPDMAAQLTKLMKVAQGNCAVGRICWVNPTAIEQTLNNDAFKTDACFCDLEFLNAVSGPFDSVYKTLIPALVGAGLMLAAVSWMLMHAASQWARARSEGNMMSSGSAPRGSTLA